MIRSLLGMLLCLLGFGLDAAARANGDVRIAEVEPRIWSCDFSSRALGGTAMRFLVILPEGITRGAAAQPVIYFLPGRGRHERTLLEYEQTRSRVMSLRCALVLPRGRDGWYINSPVTPADRYADYLDEVMALAEEHFPLCRPPRSRFSKAAFDSLKNGKDRFAPFGVRFSSRSADYTDCHRLTEVRERTRRRGALRRARLGGCVWSPAFRPFCGVFLHKARPEGRTPNSSLPSCA